jgi:D-alanine--poly(phosphoribitol) ligase subunit 1
LNRCIAVNLNERAKLTTPSVLGDIINRALTDPEHLAAKDLDRELTYRQLVDEAARLGTGLRARGVVEHDRVALLIPNSVDFVVAALATLWVGAFFVPLAVTDPPSRLMKIVADSAPALIITSDQDDGSVPVLPGSTPVVSMDQLREEKRTPAIDTDAVARPVYMIYTSGTTGTPKGVQIGNEAFYAAVHSTANALGLNESTRTLCVSPFHFDGSYSNLFTTLVSGGTVIIRPRDALLFPRTFFNTVANERINYSGFTPSYFRLLLASKQMSTLANSTLEMIALGGEAVSVSDLRALWTHAPAMRVFNRYGPTETTIAVTNVELTPDIVDDGTVPIGRPHQGVSFVLIDENEHVVDATNQVGELYIGGVQLMDGYWAAPALTTEVLRHNIVPGEIFYRTGDLVYRNKRGNYVYVDRSDRVVKRSGVRTSLVELSASMNELDGVVSAACVTFDREGELGIVAFIVTDSERSPIELRRAASTLIPENMLPDRIELVAAMPLNRSNMLDEARLLAEAGLRPFRRTSTPPPVRT